LEAPARASRLIRCSRDDSFVNPPGIFGLGGTFVGEATRLSSS
jgi:hypothetical protein